MKKDITVEDYFNMCNRMDNLNSRIGKLVEAVELCVNMSRSLNPSVQTSVDSYAKGVDQLVRDIRELENE